jgi:hypothetical protein
MSTIALVARRDFPYNGRQVRAGEVFEASAVDAVVLLNANRAKFADGAPPSDPEPVTVAVAEAEPSPVDKPKRKYTRRNLTAEDGEEPTPKRQYHRRDLEPEA